MEDSGFTYEVDIPVRYRDIDAMGWVHNSVLLIYVEEARMRYFAEVLGIPKSEANGAIVRQDINYESAVEGRDHVTVRQRVTEVGDSSLTMEFEVESDGQPAASGSSTFVFLDQNDNPETIPEDRRHKIQEFEDATFQKS